jgi:hypothetical protein
MSFKPTRCPSWPVLYPPTTEAFKPILAPVGIFAASSQLSATTERDGRQFVAQVLTLPFGRLSAALLGHASVQLTLDRYSHWMPSMGRHTASAMDEALG